MGFLKSENETCPKCNKTGLLKMEYVEIPHSEQPPHYSNIFECGCGFRMVFESDPGEPGAVHLAMKQLNTLYEKPTEQMRVAPKVKDRLNVIRKQNLKTGKPETYSETLLRIIQLVQEVEEEKHVEETKQIFDEAGFCDLLNKLGVDFLDVYDDTEYIVFVPQGKTNTPQLQKLRELMTIWGEDFTVSELEYLTSDKNFHEPREDYYRDEVNGWIVCLWEGKPTIEPTREVEQTLIEWLGYHHPARVMEVLKKLAKDEEIEIGDMIIHPDKDYLLIFNPEDEDVFAGCVQILEKLWDHEQSRTGLGFDVVVCRCIDESGEEVLVHKHVSYWQGSADYTATKI